MAYANFVSTWISAIAARLAGKRVLFWTHGWTRNESGPKAWVRVLFYKLAHGLLLYGHHAKVAGITKGFAPEKLYVIYNSLDYEAQKQAREAISREDVFTTRRALFTDPNRPLVICSARLTKACRFDLLLRAQAELERQGHRINVLLVGDGPERNRLECLATSYGISVKFYGSCYDETILARLTTAANVTVSPGKVGLTAMQSLVFGTPVITHGDFEAQMPECEAIIPGKTGAFFKRDDPIDLARVIREWTGSRFVDPERRQQCYQVLEQRYNPAFQRRAIDRAVRSEPADDLFWIRGGNDFDDDAALSHRARLTLDDSLTGATSVAT